MILNPLPLHPGRWTLIVLLACIACVWAGSAPAEADQSDPAPAEDPTASAGEDVRSESVEAEEEAEPSVIRRYGDRISVFGDPIHVPANTIQRGMIVCIGSDAIIEGEVREILVIGGSLKLTGRVRGQVVSVLSDVEFDGAEVGGQLVNIGGSMERRDSYIGGPTFNLSLGEWLGGLPSPFGVIGGILFWIRVFKLFLAFVVVLLLAAMVPERIRLIGDEAPVRYGMALIVGLLAYLVAPLVWILLAATVLGLPIGILLFHVLKWLGIAGIFFAIGRRIGRSMGREMSLLGGVLLVFAVFVVLLLFPFLCGLAGAGCWFR